ncbi:MAG: FKBP-type peptidyl-prolyl cis-trans isomerase [Bacteroidota bacterium]
MLALKKVFFFPLIIVGLFFTSCDDRVTFEQQQKIDKDIIDEYVADNNLDGFYTENNIFISLENEGTGTETPDAFSTIEIIYTGYLLDGTEFDSSAGFPREFQVFTLIQGWQEGLAFFKTGSKGTMIIPSRFAYRTAGTPDGSVPPDAVIAFDIELLSFRN